ncbi:DNA-3-methyladenine glycosylase [soil metagenome]
MIDWLALTPQAAARRLIGATLILGGVGGRVVETEAYDAEDPASHSFAGQTPRNAAMFGPVGRAYVYRAYGLHLCLNLVCGPRPGGAVLFRALEPLTGIDRMIDRRGLTDLRRLASGPGRLCQALAVGAEHNGLEMTAPPFTLALAADRAQIASGPRIGITKAAHQPWRYGLAGSPFLSRPIKP